MNEMNGKWALVTGASSGFGVDFATLLPERNANLMLAARCTEMFLALWVQCGAHWERRISTFTSFAESNAVKANEIFSP
jgi:short-subunit dehydrogenase